MSEQGGVRNGLLAMGAVVLVALTPSGCGTPACIEDEPAAIAPSWVLNYVDRNAAHVEVVAVRPQDELTDRAVVIVEIDGERRVAVEMERGSAANEHGCTWNVVDVESAWRTPRLPAAARPG